MEFLSIFIFYRYIEMKQDQLGICQLPIIPMRKEPSETSEQVSQVLFGELFEILEEKNNWLFIKLHFDNYLGWISKKMVSKIENYPLKPDFGKNFSVLKDSIGRIVLPGKKPEYIYIPGGSELLKENAGFIIGSLFFTFDPVSAIHEQNSAIDITGTALKYLNAPYLWGGRTIFGIDCSGFTQLVYKMNGLKIPRDAYQQAETGKIVHFLDDALPGDLVFFDNNDGIIIHTGILIDKSTIIHASGKVKIDKIDHQGIFDEDLNSYSHKLRIIKRIIN